MAKRKRHFPNGTFCHIVRGKKPNEEIVRYLGVRDRQNDTLSEGAPVTLVLDDSRPCGYYAINKQNEICKQCGEPGHDIDTCFEIAQERLRDTSSGATRGPMEKASPSPKPPKEPTLDEDYEATEKRAVKKAQPEPEPEPESESVPLD